MSEHELLDILDENNNIIGTGVRKEIHQKGLRHNTVAIWFYNIKGQVVFQKRHKSKNSISSPLGFTVGGHVVSGQSIIDMAVQEIQEETGVTVLADELIFIDRVLVQLKSRVTDEFYNHLENIFAYYFEGDICDLVVEPGEGDGFEWWSVEKVLSCSQNEKEIFNRAIFVSGILESLKKVLELSKD